MNLTVVTAGLGRPSSTRLLADRLATATVRELGGAEVRVVEIRDHAHALVDALISGFPTPGLRDALDVVAEADGLIAVTPVFAASAAGLFKTFFDVLDLVDGSALEGKPVLLGATGGTARHSLVPETAMRPLFAYLRALVVPTSVFAAPEDWAGALGERIDRAASELAREIHGRPRRLRADPFAPTPFEDLLARNTHLAPAVPPGG